jgi:hypothetical protein
VLQSGGMNKFNFSNYSQFSDLPLENFNTVKFSIYVLDFDWNYLFINDFVKRNLGSRADNLIGKNMWREFEELATDPSFAIMRKNAEKGLQTNIVTTSPVNSQRLNIIGHTLKDCWLFSASILPDKDELLDELRNVLKNTSAK